MLQVIHDHSTVVITLNRVERRNALNGQMVQLLHQAIQEAYDDAACRVIILTGAGPAFCAGADLDYLQQLQQNSFDENLADSRQLKDLFALMYEGPKPIIAAIQGDAIAGGCGLATLCDFSIASPQARFGYTEVRIGFIPALVMVFLLRKVGEGIARHLLLSGDLISAQEAVECRLINRIASDPLQAAMELAANWAKNTSPNSLKTVKTMMAQIPNLGLHDALEYAATKNAETRSHEECKRGIAAFLAKEKLEWH